VSASQAWFVDGTVMGKLSPLIHPIR
jgi:hypothetical protein